VKGSFHSPSINLNTSRISRSVQSVTFVCILVAGPAQGNEIVFAVLSTLASEFNVMDFEPLHGATRLASPTVALQYLAM